MYITKFFYYLCFLAFLLSCGKPTDQQSPSSQQAEPSQQTNTQETIDNYLEIPQFKAKLSKAISNYILNNNVLNEQRADVKVVLQDMSNDCTQMNFSYELDYTHEWNDEIEGESYKTELTDKVDFSIQIEVEEASEDNAKVTLMVKKQYISNEVSYYGDQYFDTTYAHYGLKETLSLSKVEAFENNSVSAVYQTIRGRLVRRDEIKTFSLDELGYLRNEFYARKGYIFKTDKMKSYFSKQAWYTPEVDDLKGLLNDVELKNVFYIKAMEAEIKMNASTDGKDKVSSLYEMGQHKKLTATDLKHLDVYELSYLRNEFYARKGYIFKSVRLSTYFNATDWYQPTAKNVDALLSELEKENISFIKSLELEKQ